MQIDKGTHDSVHDDTSTYSKEMQAVLDTSGLARYCLAWLRKREEYNGWSNYATWRINLEIVDPAGDNYTDGLYESIGDLADTIKENCERYIESEGGEKEGVNFAISYALAFMQDVNWYEIAEHIAEDYPSIIKQYEDD